MEIDVENRRHLALLSVGVVAVAVVASVGFASLSNNPLVPDASFDARDAPEEYALNRSGTVEMAVVEHEGGDSVPADELELVIGSRTDGTKFNASANWTVELDELTFAVLLNGQRLRGTDTYEEGDRLVIAKTSGTGTAGGTYTVRLRLFHLPSQKTILDQRVEVT